MLLALLELLEGLQFHSNERTKVATKCLGMRMTIERAR